MLCAFTVTALYLHFCSILNPISKHCYFQVDVSVRSILFNICSLDRKLFLFNNDNTNKHAKLEGFMLSIFKLNYIISPEWIWLVERNFIKKCSPIYINFLSAGKVRELENEMFGTFCGAKEQEQWKRWEQVSLERKVFGIGAVFFCDKINILLIYC